MADVTSRLELLSAYLDGELATGELAEVEAILADLEGIAEFRAVREARRALRLLPQLEVPEHLLPDGHFGDRLSAYLDGELTTAEMSTVATHLVTCGTCRDELHDLDRARTAVRSLPGLEPPTPLGVHREAGPSRRRLPAAAGIGAAALVALLLGLGLRATPPPALTLEDLTIRHVARASLDPGFTVLPVGGEGTGP